MKNLNFTETAQHNRKNIDKGLRAMIVLMLACGIPAAVSRLFFWGQTREAMIRVKGVWVETEVGWPATIFGWGGFFAIAFAFFYIYIRFKQDLNQPSLGVTDDGIFINQQVLRNAFVPWHNIQKAELLGTAENPSMKITFSDTKALLKGQPFLLKSIAKANVKDTPMRFTKDETVGDIKKMYEIIHDKITPALHYSNRGQDFMDEIAFK